MPSTSCLYGKWVEDVCAVLNADYLTASVNYWSPNLSFALVLAHFDDVTCKPEVGDLTDQLVVQ